jgi:glycosyltransferase involved in cell wall biosynthesis
MRLLYIMPAEAFGGAERQGVVHIANLPRSGIEVVAVVGPGLPILGQLDRAGVSNYVFFPDFPAINVEGRGLLTHLWRPVGYLWKWRKSVLQLIALARRERVDMIFASRTFGWTVGWVVAQHLGLPVVWRAGSQPSSRSQLLALHHVAPLFVPDLLVTNCEVGRHIYGQAVPAPTVVIRNGVDTERFSPERVSPRLRQDLNLMNTPVVGLAARPAPEKGLTYLAKVVDLVARDFPDVRFLVAGEFPWREHFQRLFARHGLDARVTFLGHVKDIESFYGACDVVVLTSERRSIELSSNAIIEAMSVGRAVVVTDVGGMTEVVEDGYNGFVASPNDAAAFAQRVSLLLADPQLRHNFGAAARLQIVQRHSQEKVSAKLATFLQAVSSARYSGTEILRRLCQQEA